MCKRESDSRLLQWCRKSCLIFWPWSRHSINCYTTQRCASYIDGFVEAKSASSSSDEDSGTENETFCSLVERFRENKVRVRILKERIKFKKCFFINTNEKVEKWQANLKIEKRVFWRFSYLILFDTKQWVFNKLAWKQGDLYMLRKIKVFPRHRIDGEEPYRDAWRVGGNLLLSNVECLNDWDFSPKYRDDSLVRENNKSVQYFAFFILFHHRFQLLF